MGPPEEETSASRGIVHELIRLRTLFDALLAVLGLFTIIKGWQSYTRTLPKPTETDQVTHTDYLSGNYERDLEEREKTLHKNRLRGRLFVLGGIGLVGTGVFFLSRVMTAPADAETPSRDKERATNGAPRNSPTRSS